MFAEKEAGPRGGAARTCGVQGGVKADVAKARGEGGREGGGGAKDVEDGEASAVDVLGGEEVGEQDDINVELGHGGSLSRRGYRVGR